MSKRILIAAALLIAASVANAQHLPPGKWWQRTEIVQQLGLTSEQRDRLDVIFRGAADGLIDAKAAVEKLQISLRGELDRPQVRRAEVLKIAQDLNAARGRLFEREISMLLDMRGVLTDQQWNEMRDHLDRERPGPGHGRPGMPPPRGRRP